jgi:23S rRNA (guanine2445-N2)-methyltransferase / 23S rRNA (guanine2069-N7)-methyltransferase
MTLEQFDVDDITRATIPTDFARNPKIHVCFRMRPKPVALARG